MGRIIHICVCIFASILATTAMLAQNPFTNYKGKGYEDIAAYRMKKVIDLNTYIPSAPILYEQSVPEHQNTLSYKVALPPYLCGAFFSRDSRTDDHQWPNNTNRLLPWMFVRLQELTRDNYPGIPSNSQPSTLGDALLLQLSNGEYLFVKAVAGDNSLSWLQVNADGTLTLYLLFFLRKIPFYLQSTHYRRCQIHHIQIVTFELEGEVLFPLNGLLQV